MSTRLDWGSIWSRPRRAAELYWGIIVFCMLYVATQASVIERPGVLGAIKRSRELTRGHKLEIFGLVFLLALLSFGLRKLCETTALPHLGSPGFIDEILRNVPTYMYLTLAEQMFVGSLSAVMASVAYYFLRAEKEGISAAELASGGRTTRVRGLHEARCAAYTRMPPNASLGHGERELFCGNVMFGQRSTRCPLSRWCPR